jgi:hypothetical protein
MIALVAITWNAAKRQRADYLLTYVLAEQLGQSQPPEDAPESLLTVRIDGVEYVHLYALR